jgi:hypothetical protein
MLGYQVRLRELAVSKSKQHQLKSESNEKQSQKKSSEQIKAARNDLPAIFRKVSTNSLGSPQDILTLQQNLGNRTVHRMLAEDSRLKPEIKKGEAGSKIVRRRDIYQMGDKGNKGDGETIARGGDLMPPLEMAIQREAYFDLYERSRKLEELRQKKRQLQQDRDKTVKALKREKAKLYEYQVKAGEKEGPGGGHVRRFIEDLLGIGNYSHGEAGKEQRKVMRARKIAAWRARKKEKLIAKGEARKKELEDQIKSVDGEIAAYTMSE